MSEISIIHAHYSVSLPVRNRKNYKLRLDQTLDEIENWEGIALTSTKLALI